LVQGSVLERIKDAAATYGDDYERVLSGYETHAMLKEKIDGLPFMGAVAIIGADGKLISFSRGWPAPPIDVTDRSYFVALKSDPQATSFLSEPVLNRATGEWTIFLVRKIADANGRFLGVVLGAVELNHLERYFREIELGPGSSVSLFRSDGMLLARYPRRDVPGTSYANGPLFRSGLLDKKRVVGRFASLIDVTDGCM